MAKKLSVLVPRRLRNLYFFLSFFSYNIEDTVTKGPVKLIQRVKIAHSFTVCQI